MEIQERYLWLGTLLFAIKELFYEASLKTNGSWANFLNKCSVFAPWIIAALIGYCKIIPMFEALATAGIVTTKWNVKQDGNK